MLFSQGGIWSCPARARAKLALTRADTDPRDNPHLARNDWYLARVSYFLSVGYMVIMAVSFFGARLTTIRIEVVNTENTAL